MFRREINFEAHGGLEEKAEQLLLSRIVSLKFPEVLVVFLIVSEMFLYTLSFADFQTTAFFFNR